MSSIIVNMKKNKPQYNSTSERKVMEILSSIHSVYISKYSRLTDDEREIIKQIARKKSHYLQKKAIFLMTLSNDPRHVKELEKIIKNKKHDKFSKIAAIISLGMSKDPNAESVLISFINDRDNFIKYKIIQSLGRVGSINSFSILTKMSKNKSKFVKRSAIEAKKLICFRLRIEEDIK